jgi:5,6,7,8-tetrahydromethanopterin hydro-lyase
VKEKLLPRDLASQLVIAAMWVDPAADDEELVFANNSLATLEAFRMAAAGGPAVRDALVAMLDPANPYFRRG